HMLSSTRTALVVNHAIHLTVVQFVRLGHHPAPLAGSIVRAEFGREYPQVLARMIQNHDLDGVGEVQLNDVPDPFGAISDHHLLLRASPTPVPSLGIKT